LGVHPREPGRLINWRFGKIFLGKEFRLIRRVLRIISFQGREKEKFFGGGTKKKRVTLRRLGYLKGRRYFGVLPKHFRWIFFPQGQTFGHFAQGVGAF